MNLDGRRLGAAAGALEPAGKVGGHCAVGAAEPGGLKAVIARRTLSAGFEVKQATPRVARDHRLSILKWVEYPAPPSKTFP
jgi:hypothetical protein